MDSCKQKTNKLTTKQKRCIGLYKLSDTWWCHNTMMLSQTYSSCITMQNELILLKPYFIFYALCVYFVFL